MGSMTCSVCWFLYAGMISEVAKLTTRAKARAWSIATELCIAEKFRDGPTVDMCSASETKQAAN
jgi:hypothetical protein